MADDLVAQDSLSRWGYLQNIPFLSGSDCLWKNSQFLNEFSKDEQR
jgi:hypothetical protein